jgi:hypothetical protein
MGAREDFEVLMSIHAPSCRSAPVFAARILPATPDALAPQLARLAFMDGVAIRQAVPQLPQRQLIVPVSPRGVLLQSILLAPRRLIPRGTLSAPIRLIRE